MADPAVFRRSLVSSSPDETRALGERLGAAAEAGDTFLLDGDFGAGKTVLVQGLARGLGISTEITSPSFVLVNQHEGRLCLFHVDLFRLEQLDHEMEDTIADLLEAGGVVAIEWPRLLPTDLRRGSTLLRLRQGDSETRIVQLETPQERLASEIGPDTAPAPVWGGRRAARD